MYSTEVQQFEGSDEFFIELPQELCEAAGWEIGDTITWAQMPSGTWHLNKVAK